MQYRSGLMAVTLMLIASLFVLVGCEKKEEPQEKEKTESGESGTDKEGTTETSAPTDEPAEPPSYGGEFCGVVMPCFKKFEFVGNFNVKLVVDIAASGGVDAVSVTGEPPPPIQKCIVEGVKGITLSDYNGKRGQAACGFSGQLMEGGVEMVSSTGVTYKELPASTGAAGDETETDGEGATDEGGERATDEGGEGTTDEGDDEGADE